MSDIFARPLFRFAPSPNGRLHLGHAYSALLNAASAAAVDGVFLLRIEDIDQPRFKPEYEQAIIADLAWLGLTFAQAPPSKRVCRRLRRRTGGAGGAGPRLSLFLQAGRNYPRQRRR